MWSSAFRTSILTLAIGVFLQASGRSAHAQCEVAKLTAPDAGVGDQFGYSVSLSDDVVVVGAFWADGSASGSGAGYVFRWSGTAWDSEAKLMASDGAGGDDFGWSVSASGDVAVVGSPENDQPENQCGAAYVYRWDGAAWAEEQKLTASDATRSAHLGTSVAVSDQVAVVGAPYDRDVGAAYVYRWNGTTWIEEQKLTAPDEACGDQFGGSVAASGDVVVVGAPRDDSEAGYDCGSVYIFRWNGTSWVEEQKVTASDAASSDRFGRSVSVSDESLLVGAPYSDDVGFGLGSAYVFAWSGATWVEQQKLTAVDGRQFGTSIAVDGDVAVVGACLGNSAYAFKRHGSTWLQHAKLTASDEGADFGCSVAVSGDYVVVGADYADLKGAAYVFRALGEPDCNLNGINDACETDCNANGIPDDCDIAEGTSQDCTGNGMPDECEPDCNENTIPDSCDINDGTSQDCTGNGIPDECEPDCNGNDVADSCDIAAGTSQDCNSNGVPDDCDIAAGTSDDRNDNEIPDECQTACCDPISGTCTDGELTCSEGRISLGAGTNCNSNCCQQPVDTGGDNCQEVFIHQITVPPSGEPPVIVTITGNNSNATYDDFPDFCDWDMFDPDTLPHDRGWWEAFHIDDCAFVTVDMCCTEPAHPGWSFLTAGCPCETWVDSLGYSPSVDPPPSLCPDGNDRGFFAPLPAGTYYYPISSYGCSRVEPYQAHITAEACAPAACCLGSTCEMLNELECDTVGGYFLGDFGGSWLFYGPTCGEAPDGSDNPCSLGACCTAPGVCVDDDGSGGGMDEELCTALGGTFTGGADCASVTEFCPACVIRGEGNCQVSDFADLFRMHLSDLTVPPFGVTSADDFIPAGDTIGSICVWGTYMDSSAPSPPGWPYKEYSCVGHVKDNFRIRIYQDVGGFPGSQVGSGRWVTGEDVYRAEIPADNSFTSTYGISVLCHMLTLDPPIELPEANVTYWLEVANKTDTLAGETEPTENTCYWHWAQVYREYGIGNDYSVMGTDDRPDDQGGGSGYIPWAASARSTDLAFCLGTPDGALAFTTPETPLGSCCMCDQTCQADQTLEDCDDQLTGTWLPEDGCPTNLCKPQAGQTCAGGREGPWIPPEGGLFGFDTSCAPTDGPAETIGLDPNMFMHDIWLEYVTNCTGRLVVSMCATGNSKGAYDSVLALYSDRSGTCLCPLSSETQQGVAKDENCNGIPDTGAGIYTSDIVYPGECWLIRVGGFASLGEEAGAGLIDVRCVPRVCMPSQPPEPDVLPLAGEPVNQKVRYLSFQVGETDAGREQAIRVTFVDLPAPFDSWNGTKMFVGPPEMYCENAGNRRPPCPPAQPEAEFRAATLQSSAEFRDWSTEGVVHVFHEGIVPGGVYHVQAVDETCELNLDSSYSDPLIVQMSPWGDLVTDCTTCPCGPPDGVVGIPTDVTAVLDKFRNLAPPSVPCPAVSKVRADLDWATPNQRVDISDVTCCLDAFRGFEYPFGVADPCP